MNKLSFVILQSETSSLIGTLIASAFVIALLLGVFLIIRSLVLWYWRVDVIVKNQEEQILLLRKQAQLSEQQVKLLDDVISKLSNNSNNPNAGGFRI